MLAPFVESDQREMPQQAALVKKWLARRNDVWAEALKRASDPPAHMLQVIDLETVMSEARDCMFLRGPKFDVFEFTVQNLVKLWVPSKASQRHYAPGTVSLPATSSVRKPIVAMYLR